MEKKEDDKTETIIKPEVKDMVREFVESQISAERGKGLVITRKVVYDGKQYSVRIPQKIADALKLKKGIDKFKFTVDVKENKPKLLVELIRDEENV